MSVDFNYKISLIVFKFKFFLLHWARNLHFSSVALVCQTVQFYIYILKVLQKDFIYLMI